ncbi:MAG: choice-of-anchor B family protein [Flavobacteriales bacterium]
MRALLLIPIATLFACDILAQTPCVGGLAGGYPCDKVDLMAHLSLAQLGATGGSPNAADLWGWTDPLTQREYAIIGINNGTAFVDITDPALPVRVGNLPSHLATSNLWRDVDVAGNWCYISSELSGHGMQVFDLTRLRNVVNPPVAFTEDGWSGVISRSHTLYADKLHPYVYAVGTNIAGGGLVVMDVSNPIAPVLAGTFDTEGYIHENVVYTYAGPDADHTGKQLSFNFHTGTDRITVVDVTDKTDMNTLVTINYTGGNLCHQGWLTEDQRYLLMDDEGDEGSFGHGTRTRIFDLVDLDVPVYLGAFTSALLSTDHNQYTHKGLVFQSNYTSGLRILDLAPVSTGTLTPLASFDTYTPNNAAGYNGAWGNYPYFASGSVIISDLNGGLFVVKPRLSLRSKVMLDGPYDSNTLLMHDSLRVRNMVPSTQPYTALGLPPLNTPAVGGLSPAVLAVTGNNALVDWVAVELRDPLSPTTVKARAIGVVQRDGDIVATDGTSPIQFSVAVNDYLIAVRHRTHLGAMMATAQRVSISEKSYDFTNGSLALFGTNATKTIGAVQVLWAGNAVNDVELKYTGTANDRDPILVAVGGTVPTATVSGYLPTDVNMDGTVKYTGAVNDRDRILVNVGGTVPTTVRHEQLP